jgi:hypothetical protein
MRVPFSILLVLALFQVGPLRLPVLLAVHGPLPILLPSVVGVLCGGASGLAILSFVLSSESLGLELMPVAVEVFEPAGAR